MSAVSKPFDLLFKHTLSSDVAIKDFLKNYVPAHLYQRIDLHSIQPTSQSYVLPELKEFYNDLAYTCTIDNGQTSLYFLVEHQSKPSRLLPLRFIKYQTALIESLLQGKRESTPWPLIFCVCIYHGARTPYPYSSNTYDYFSDLKLAQDMSVFLPFHLIDLTVLDDAAIERHGSLALMEKVFKYSSRRKDFYYPVPSILRENRSLLDQSATNPLAPDHWHAVYLVVNRLFIQQGYGKEAAAELFSGLMGISKTEIMTVTQVIRQEGIQQGMRKGMQKGIQQGVQQGMQRGMHTKSLEIAKNMLYELHLDMKVVSKATGLSQVELMKLQAEGQANS